MEAIEGVEVKSMSGQELLNQIGYYHTLIKGNLSSRYSQLEEMKEKLKILETVALERMGSNLWVNSLKT